MKIVKFASLALAAATLVGCAAPSFNGNALSPDTARQPGTVVIVKDSDTRAGFLSTMENWLSRNGYRYQTIPDGSQPSRQDLALQYRGTWRWDMALFLNEAEIEAYQGGKRVGKVQYKAPNSLNAAKYSTASERIDTMMDILFGKVSADSATISVGGASKNRKPEPYRSVAQ